MVCCFPTMSRAKVYLETTVISYLAARPSRDLLVAAHQQITSDWWEHNRLDFDLFVSQLVVEEASAGDSDAAIRRLKLIEAIDLIGLTEASLALAEKLLANGAVPADSEEDALHVAIAAVNGMDYVLTWNCRHIANVARRSHIEATCLEAGYAAPIICTPEELLEV